MTIGAGEAMADRDSASSRSALESLKARVLETPELAEARRALAEAYRVRGFPDQAGRWGILVDGWATEVEIDRLARLIAASAAGPKEVRELLLLPERAELPADLAALLDGPVKQYRKQFGVRNRRRHLVDSKGAKIAEAVAVAAVLGTAWTALLGVLVVYFMSVGGASSTTLVARVSGAIMLVLVAIALIATAVRSLIRLIWRRPADSEPK